MIINSYQSDLSDSSNNNNSPNDDQPSSESNSSENLLPPSKVKKNFLKERVSQYWKRLSLQRKATFVAVAIGVTPIVAVGGIAHNFAAKSMMRQIIQDQESRTFDIRQKVSLFTNHVISDATTIANAPFLTSPELRNRTSVQEKTALLNNFIDEHPQERYSSIAVFDLQGKLLFQSKSTHPIDSNDNYSNRHYFQRAISTKSAAVNDPEIHSSSGKHSMDVASPIIEKGTGTMLGVVTVRMPLSHWKEIFQYIQSEGWEYRLIDTEGYIFDSDEAHHIGRVSGVDLDGLPQLEAKMKTQERGNVHNLALTEITYDQDDEEKVLATLTSIPGIEGLPLPGWQMVVSRPEAEAFVSLRELRLTLLLGTGAAALLVGAISAFITNRAILPILKATEAVKRIGRGELNTHLEVQGQDELALLGSNINKMAQQLKALVGYKEAEAERSQKVKDLTLKLSRTINSEEVFQIAVDEILTTLQADRVLVYSLDPNGQGKIVA